MNNKPKILIVDDELNIIHALSRLFPSKDYELCSTTNPNEAFAILLQQEIDIILCDQRMPEISGSEVLSYSKKVSSGTVRILITGYSDIDAIIHSINDSSIYYYISKPWENEKVIEVIKSALLYKNQHEEEKHILDTYSKENYKLTNSLNQLESKIDSINSRVIKTLLKIIEVKDIELFNHSNRVSAYSVRIAELMKLSPIQRENIKLAALLHDIGKIAIRDNILYKPGKLDENEFDKIKSHTVVGYEILNNFDFLSDTAMIVLQHHEKVDGTGYPYTKHSNEILIEAKIVSVADTYDALTSERSYKKPFKKENAISLLRNCIDTSYDKEIVELFISMVSASEN